MESPLIEKVVEKIKSGYFFLEDRYYAVLDKINKQVPIYKVVDPVDKVVPSFLVLAAIILLLALFFVFIAQAAVPMSATLRVVDSKGEYVPGVSIELSSESFDFDSFETDEFGETIVSLPSPKIDAEGTFTKEGYLDLKRTVTLKANKSSEVTLQLKPSDIDLQPKDLTIRVYDSRTNQPITKKVILTFECSSGAFPPEKQEGTTGQFEVVKPANCSSLSATAEAEGYAKRSKTLSSTINTLYLSSDSAPTETTGRLNVLVKDSGNNPEPDATVRVIDETTDLETDSSSTGASGNALISSLQPGLYTVSVITPDGRTGRETGIYVRAGQTETVTITLISAADALSKKIFLEVKEEGPLAVISEVQVFIYENGVMLDSTSSDSSGIINKRIVEPADGATYLVVLAHPEFITKIVDDVPLKELSDDIPIAITMTRASMEDPATSSEILITVVDEERLPVEDALVTVYDSEYPEIPLKTPPGRTLEDGTYLLTNLAPDREYFAKAKDQDGTSEGQSDTGTTTAGETLNLEVMVVLGQGDIEVLVFDAETENKAPIPNAEVEFIDAYDFPTVVATCTTGPEGSCTSEPIPADKYVVVKAKATGFMPAYSVSRVDIINRNTADVEIGLEHESSIPPGIGKMDIRFRSFCQDRKCENSADKIESDEAGTLTYYAKFELIFAEDASYENTVQHIRAGPDSEISLPAPTGYKIKLMNAHGPLFTSAPLSSCWNNDPVDPFTDPEECATQLDAKQVNIYYPDLEGKQIIPVVVEFSVEAGLEDGEELEMHYKAKTSVSQEDFFTENKVKYFLIDEFLCEGQDIAWSFSLINPDESEAVLETGEDAANELEVNQGHALAFELYNCSNQDFSSAALKAEVPGTDPEAISFTAAEPYSKGPVNASGEETFSFAADTILAGQLPFYTVAEADLTNIVFNFSGAGRASTKTIPFSIESNLRLRVPFVPSKLAPYRPENLWGEVQDASLRTPIENAHVKLEIDGQDPRDFTTGADGQFSFESITGLEGLSEVTLTVRKAGYKTFEETIPIGTDSGAFNPDLECVGIEKNTQQEFSLHFVRNSTVQSQIKDTFEVVNGCDSPVLIRINSELKTDKANDFALDPDEKETVTVYAEAWENHPDMTIGEYGVMVTAKYTADPPAAPFFGPLATATVYVTDPTSCFRLADPASPDNPDLMKSTFNIVEGSDEGLIVNECFAYFEDLKMPRLDTVRGYLAVEDIFKLIFNPPTKPAETIGKQKIFDPSNPGFGGSGMLSFNAIDSGGYVFVEWVDFLMTDGAHDSGAKHRVWAQTNRSVWSNVTSQLPFTDAHRGPAAPSSLPHPVIDNEGWVDVDTYYKYTPGEHPYSDLLTNNPMWQGQHNVCNINLTGFEPGLSECSVPSYFQGNPTVPYKVGMNASKIRLESSQPATTNVSAARWQYISTDADHDGIIDFTMQNRGLMGETYALIEVEDTTDVQFVVSGEEPSSGITVAWALSKSCNVKGEGTVSPMPGPLVATPGQVIAMSVDEAVGIGSPAGVFDSLEAVPVNDLLPENPKNISEVTLVLNENQEQFKIEDLSPDSTEEMVLMVYSGGAWERVGRFDAENTGAKTLQYTDILSAELIALVNSTNATDMMVDDIFMNYFIINTEEAQVGQGSLAIPIGEISAESDMPPDNTGLECIPGTSLYTLSTDSTEAVVYFSESKSPTHSDPYGISGEQQRIVAATSSPEQAGNTQTERFHVRVVGEAATQCISESGMVGSTGIGSKPRVLLDWDWGAITTETCNEANESFVYCDPAQFTASLIKRLEEIRTLAADDITGNLMEIRQKQLFKAYLIEDAYTPDFRNDFVEFYANQFLVDEMANEKHPWGNYLLDQEKLVLNTEAARSESDPQEPDMVGAGLHEIYIDFDFSGDQFDFFYVEPQPDGSNQVDLLANITVYITKFSDPVIQNPFYYLPFNGDVGREDGVLQREGYGLSFENDSQPLMVVGDLAQGYTTVSPEGSTARKTVLTENISDFLFTNLEEKGMLLKVENNQNEIKFSPSIATPVLAETVSSENKAEAFYNLRDGSTVVSGPGTLASWSGSGSSMRMDGICTDFHDNKLRKSIADMPGSGCASSVEGSYGFSYEPAPNDEKLYLETVFYTPASSAVHLRKSCENESNFYAPDVDGIQKTTQLSTPISLSLENFETRVVSLDDLVRLVGDSYICVSQSEDSQYFTFWWNPQRVQENLGQVKAAISNWPELDCSGALSSE